MATRVCRSLPRACPAGRPRWTAPTSTATCSAARWPITGACWCATSSAKSRPCARSDRDRADRGPGATARSATSPAKRPGTDRSSRSPRTSGVRGMVKRRSGSWLADSPTSTARVLDDLHTAGVIAAISTHLGERVFFSLQKSTLRRSAPKNELTGWHQDGSFLGPEVRTMNVWVSLSRCGGVAPAPGLPGRTPPGSGPAAPGRRARLHLDLGRDRSTPRPETRRDGAGLLARRRTALRRALRAPHVPRPAHDGASVRPRVLVLRPVALRRELRRVPGLSNIVRGHEGVVVAPAYAPPHGRLTRSTRLLGPVRGKRVLELGCGTGRRRGPVRPAGRDGHRRRQLGRAHRRRARRGRSRRRSASSCTPATSPISRSSAPTRWTSRSATVRSRRIADLGRLFRQVHRVLRHGASFVFSLPAPDRARHRDRGAARGRAPARAHLPHPLVLRPGADRRRHRGRRRALLTRHTLSEVFTGLSRTGFRVDTLLEPEPPPVDGGRALLPAAVIWRARKEGS